MPKQNTPNRRPGLVEMGPALTGVGTLLAGLAALLALVVSAGGNDGSAATAAASAGSIASSGVAVSPPDTEAPTVPATVSPTAVQPSATAAVVAPFFSKVLLEDDLRTKVPGLFTTSSGCSSAFTVGLDITSSATFANCMVDLGPAQRAILGLAEVRVQVTVTYASYQVDGLSADIAGYGGGDAGIMCRVNGLAANGDYYTADLTPLGWWQIYRYVDGASTDSTGGSVPDLATPVGGSRLLQLDCSGSAGGPTTVSLSVDGTLVGTYQDPDGLAAGSVALSVANYATDPATATFTGLRVLGAGD